MAAIGYICDVCGEAIPADQLQWSSCERDLCFKHHIEQEIANLVREYNQLKSHPFVRKLEKLKRQLTAIGAIPKDS